MRDVVESEPAREIRLFEGLVSFKPQVQVSSHVADVLALGRVVSEKPSGWGSIIASDEFAREPGDRIESACRVAGIDFGVPPVVVVGGNSGGA